MKRKGTSWNHRRAGSVCALAASLCLITEAYAAPRTLYRETYGYCSGTIGKDAATETNWVGLVSGLPQAKISNLKVFSYGNLDIGSSVNSNPIGLAQGYTFWFKPVYGLTVLTAEFQFDVGALKNSQAAVLYKQRLSGIDLAGQPNKTHLAILVDDVWYISAEFARQVQPGVWESAELSPASLTYGTAPYVAGLGPAKPEVFGAPLPAAGTVRAFGVFMDEVNGRVRLDNFTIRGLLPSNGSISDAIQPPDVSLCPASSPDRNGGGRVPTPPPDEDDGDDTPDRFVPQPIPTATPGPIGVHGTVYQFCPVKEQGTGKKVVVSSKARASIVKKITGATLADLRDRAIISIFAQRPMSIGSVVNIKRGDYDAQKSMVTVSTRSSAKPVLFKLRGAARKALQLYVEHPSVPKENTAPLFVDAGAAPHAAHVTTQRALCLLDVRTMLRARAGQAKVPLQGITGPRGR